MGSLQDLLPLELWFKCLDLLPLQDKINCLMVCMKLRMAVYGLLKRQTKLWIRNKNNSPAVNCFDPNHVVTLVDSVSYSTPPSGKQLKQFASFFPSVTVLRFDPIVIREEISDEEDEDFGQQPPLLGCFYRDTDDNQYRIGEHFPSVQCFLLPGSLHRTNLQGPDGSRHGMKHLLAERLATDESNFEPLLPSLESLELLRDYHDWEFLPRPSKRLVAPGSWEYVQGSSLFRLLLNWDQIPDTLEVCDAAVGFHGYRRRGEATKPSLKTLGRIPLRSAGIQAISDFIQDNRKNLKNIHVNTLYFSAYLGTFCASLSMVDRLEVELFSADEATALNNCLSVDAPNLRHLSLIVGADFAGQERRLERVLRNIPNRVEDLSIIGDTLSAINDNFRDLISTALMNGSPKRVIRKRLKEDNVHNWFRAFDGINNIRVTANESRIRIKDGLAIEEKDVVIYIQE